MGVWKAQGMRLTLAKRPRYANGHAFGKAEASAKSDRYIKLASSPTHRTPKVNLQQFFHHSISLGTPVIPEGLAG
ncbi:hypothetical protein [Moorena sp. SIO3B2]|uniref:hypothetical protein n=1 Tax=Moorena sp. SIO3B2 TaxID=2607827 RepID=UPI0013C99E8D|nr:hypothetical protein [Moorena sp. SIO3B2]NEP34235.1 hypothetical protein [Moorena sp. SIO3B2]